MQKIKNKAGFTLVEILVALFIFSLGITMVTKVFSEFIKGYMSAKEVQRKMEGLQYAVNLMGKTLRTSTVVEYNPIAADYVKVWDYSQGRCVEYLFDSGNLKLKEVFWSGIDQANCRLTSVGVGDQEQVMIDEQFESGKFVFNVIPSRIAPKTVGKIVFSVQFKTPSGNVNDNVVFETGVSLRDYHTLNQDTIGYFDPIFTTGPSPIPPSGAIAGSLNINFAVPADVYIYYTTDGSFPDNGVLTGSANGTRVDGGNVLVINTSPAKLQIAEYDNNDGLVGQMVRDYNY